MVLQEYLLHEHLKKQLPSNSEGNKQDTPEVSNFKSVFYSYLEF